jgi:CRISPR type III-A-associated protein Csm2
MAQARRIEHIIKQIQELSSMTDLDPQSFADEGGYADEVVRAFGEDEKGKVNQKKIGDALKSTQLRKVFHALKHVQLKVKRTGQGRFDRLELLRMTPQLAYATGRGLLPKDFYSLLKVCLSPERLKSNEDFLRAFDFLEAILAYHKYRSEVGYPQEEAKQ